MHNEIQPRKHQRPRCLGLVCAVLLVVLLWSCQTLETETVLSDTTFTAVIPALAGEYLRPEFGKLRIGVDTGTANLSSQGLEYRASMSFSQAPSDTVWIGLWRAGVRYRQAGFLYQDSSVLNRVADSTDTLAAEVLRRIYPKSDLASFDSALALVLVRGLPGGKITSFPALAPMGVDTGAVMRLAMLDMVAERLPLASIVRSWAMGIDTMEVHVRIRILAQAGSVTDTSIIFPHPVPDPLIAKIMDRIRPRTDGSSFDSALAQALVDGETWVRSYGFPARTPVGVDTARVFHFAMTIMLAKKLPLVAIAKSWALGIDTLDVHVRIRLLAEVGEVTDTSIIFPLYPVRVKRALSMDSLLEVGGAPRGIEGAFVASAGIHQHSVRVFAQDQDQTDLFTLSDSLSILGCPQEVDVAGKLWIRATEGVPPGRYRLQVSMGDDSGRQATASVNFQVLSAADRRGPQIVVVAPLAGWMFENQFDSIEVKVKAADSSGVDTVWIGDRLAVVRDGFWVLRNQFVPVTTQGFEVVIRAKDHLGNMAVTSVVVGRKGALVDKFSMLLLEPQRGVVLPADSSRILVRWRVFDPRGRIDSVRIGGFRAVLEPDLVWQFRVPLLASGLSTRIPLVAFGEHGGVFTDTVEILRQADVDGPSIEFSNVVEGEVFDSSVVNLQVHLKMSDLSGIDSLKLNGRLCGVQSGEAICGVDLVSGAFNVIAAEAWDGYRNRSAATISVYAKGRTNPAAPQLQLVWPEFHSGTVVPFGTNTVTLKWIVKNPQGNSALSVSIAGVLAQVHVDTFSQKINLTSYGKPELYGIWATSLEGGQSSETVSITRLGDTSPPSLVRLQGGRAVAFEEAAAVVSWVVSDSHKLASVSINDALVPGVDGVFQRQILLQNGSNWIRILAVDSTGNRAYDSVEVVRLWKDVSKPVIFRGAGTQSQNVLVGTKELMVAWEVTDNAPVFVKIDDRVVEGQAGLYSARILVAKPVTEVVITATDSSGNQSADTVVITEVPDVTAPVLERIFGTSDTAVPSRTSSYSVAWLARDDGELRAVRICGQEITASRDGSFGLVVGLQIGTNEIKIQAVDVAGNEANDRIVVVRTP